MKLNILNKLKLFTKTFINLIIDKCVYLKKNAI